MGDASRNLFSVTEAQGDSGHLSRGFLSKGSYIIYHFFKTVLITAEGCQPVMAFSSHLS